MALDEITELDLVVLRILVANDSNRGMSAFEITEAGGIKPGSIHPNLHRLEYLRYIESRWNFDGQWPVSRRSAPAQSFPAGVPPRRYYRFIPKDTPSGAPALRPSILAAA